MKPRHLGGDDMAYERIPATNPPASVDVVRTVSAGHLAFVVGCVALVCWLSEWIGNATVPMGFTKVTLFPFLWALLICIAISVLMKRSDRGDYAYLRLQTLASDFVQLGILLFIAKLGFIVGTNLQKVIDAGWVLLAQEVGNFVGTILLAMPIALILGIKREAVGATFSVGREPGVALIAERYGMDSPEGRGVLAEYVTGSVIGAAFMAVFASMVAQTGLFSPTALGMAAGIGSGSMTAAAVGALSVQYAEQKEAIAALAAASNLLTTVVGTYILVVFSLPFANWAYARLEPWLGKNRKAIIAEQDAAMKQALGEMHSQARLPTWAAVSAVVLTSLISLIGNQIAGQSPLLDALPGMLVLVGCILIGMCLARVAAALKIPTLIWVSIVGVVVSVPYSPLASTLNPWVAKVGLLPLITPVLAYAGLSLAKDMPVLKALGWRIVVVSLIANAGAFLAGAFIAHVLGG